MASDITDILNIYVFRVTLQSNREIWRDIAIRGNQTLDDLHEAIFMAFDRFDERYYSFYVPASPQDQDNINDLDINSEISENNQDESITSSSSPSTTAMGTEYTHPKAAKDSNYWLDRKPNNASQTTIDSLQLPEFFEFTYLFDFDVNCMHNIILSRIEKPTLESLSGALNRYPMIVDSQGESPDPFTI